MQQVGNGIRLTVNFFSTTSEDEAVSKTRHTGVENKETQPLEYPLSLTGEGWLLAAFQVDRSNSGLASISESEREVVLTF